jgi:hypothetical protein
VPRHTHARRGERFPVFVQLVRLDAEGRVRLSAFLWGGPDHEYVSLSAGVAYELGRELLDAAESSLMAETWPVERLPLGAGRGTPARGAAQPGAPAIRPARAVDSRA